MSDDLTLLEPNKINWNINLPTKTQHKHNDEYSLFHCFDCGIHPQVICETYVKGNDDFIQIWLINIVPDNIEINYVLGDPIPGDVEIINNLICGVCGKPGQMEDVPEFVLIANGIIKINEMSINDE